ncbi:MAG: serine hydrolase [Candidatus Margulisiibacteriota bacterium]|jgi:beta-lactamase class A
MSRYFILVVLFCQVFALSVRADLTPDKEQALYDRFVKLTTPYGQKVGLAFIDLGTGKELTINGSREFPTASVGKVPVMAAAYALAENSLLNLDTKVCYRPQDRLGGSGILQWTPCGRYYSLRRLISLMIMHSDNTATKIVVDNLGLDAINGYLQAQGLSEIVIADPTMLREPPLPRRNLTTPLAMAHLVARIEQRQGFSESSVTEMLKFMRNQKYRWGLWRGVPSGTPIADKTGNLTGILNDIGVVYTPAGNYILGIFTSNFSQKKNARKLINSLSQAAYEEYTGKKVIFPKPVIKKKLKKRRRVKRIKKKVYRKVVKKRLYKAAITASAICEVPTADGSFRSSLRS